MLPANAKIVKCPFCGERKELLNLASGNTFGAKHWSDQKMVAPMLPRVSPIQKCPKCGKYYLEYKQPYNEGDDWSTERGELSYQQWKEAYEQLKDEKNTKHDDMQIIRHYVIMAFNDEYYRYGDNTADAQEVAFFVGIINDYIAANKWNNQNMLFKAELYREAGEMKKCEEVLSQISTKSLKEFELKIYDMIKTKMNKGDKIVFQLS